MRQPNCCQPALNKPAAEITATIYDRRALDTTALLPLVNSLSHLAYLSSISARTRHLLAQDGAMERLLQILKKDGADEWSGGAAARAAHTALLETALWQFAFQCIVNIGIRGTEAIRERVIQADIVPVIVTILDDFLTALEEISPERAIAFMAMSSTVVRRAVPPPPPVPASFGGPAASAPAEPSQRAPHSRGLRPVLSLPAHTLAVAPAPAAGPAAGARGGHRHNVAAAQHPWPAAREPINDDEAASESSTVIDDSQPQQHTGPGSMRMAMAGGSGAASATSTFAAAAAAAGLGITSHAVTDHYSRAAVAASSGQPHLAEAGALLRRAPSPSPMDAEAGASAPGARPAASRLDNMRRTFVRQNNDTPGRDEAARERQSAKQHRMPREEDVLYCLQLLAYISKYPYMRHYFQNARDAPSLRIPELEELRRQRQGFPRARAGAPSKAPVMCERCGVDVDVCGCGEDKLDTYFDAAVADPVPATRYNVFALVERFTLRMHPAEVQYWAGVIMRNTCRKDESRGGIRQCANLECGKWEEYNRQFAKCRRCRRTKYCGKECQSKAWPGHRWWCRSRQSSEQITPQGKCSGSTAGVSGPAMGSPAASASAEAAEE